MSRRGGDPVPIGKLIRDVIARRGLGGSLPLQAVKKAYAAVVPEELAARTRIASLRNGVVTIETDSAALAWELEGFRGQHLLERLRQQPETGFVTRVKFKVGAWMHDG